MIKFLIILAVTVVLFFLQQQRILSVGAVNPNLLLTFLLALTFSRIFDWRNFLIFLAILFPVLILFTGNFWHWEILIVELIALLAYFGRRYLTGNVFLDFIFLLAAGLLVFYLFAGEAAWSIIAAEGLYNLVLGLIFIFIIKGNEED